MLTVSETAALLRSFDNVLILTHVRPDGDTVGCAAALCAGLRGLGKTAYLLPNPGLTDTTAPYFAPYAAPADFTPEKVVSTDIAALSLLPENAGAQTGLEADRPAPLRRDICTPSASREALLANAPELRDGYLVVPKTV